MLLASGLGVRLELWPFGFGLRLLGIAGWTAVGAFALALIGLLHPRLRRAGLIRWLLALVLAALALAVPVSNLVRARSVPPINDISTDTEKPPQFAGNRAGYPSKDTIEQQRAAYPDIQPLRLGVAPNIAFERAKGAAEEMGWQVVAEEPSAGRIEAVATTFWFGFKDDVVIRVAADGAGSRVDIRSKSRVGRGDVGTNARRIRDYLKRLN
jgi:uncharacterized protein (DUF1499 family)